MKINYRWLAVVVLALIAGYLAGQMQGLSQGRDRLAGEDSQKGRDQMSPEWSSSSDRIRSKRRKHSRQRSVKSREQELRSILSDCSANQDQFDSLSDDPFGDDGGFSMEMDHPAWPKLCAWMMSASHAEFPEILELAEHPCMSEWAMDSYVSEVLLLRWTQLDPDGAWEWTRLQGGEGDKNLYIDASLVIIQEALLHNPEWAVEKLKGVYADRKLLYGDKLTQNPDDDPFGGNGEVGLDLNIFYRRLALMPAQQRQALRESLGSELFKFGVKGWISGMMERMKDTGLDVIAEEVTDPETGRVDTEFISALAKTDLAKAKQWVDQKGGGYEQDYTIWSHAKSKDYDTAVSWYLERSLDTEDRGRRIDDVLTAIEGKKNGIDWLTSMEAAGEPVEEAWASLIGRLASGGHYHDAVAYLPKIKDDESRGELLKSVYGKISSSNWLHGSNVEYITIGKDHQGLVLSLPGFKDHVIAKNRKALETFSAILEGVERQLQDRE